MSAFSRFEIFRDLNLYFGRFRFVIIFFGCNSLFRHPRPRGRGNCLSSCWWIPNQIYWRNSNCNCVSAFARTQYFETGNSNETAKPGFQLEIDLISFVFLNKYSKQCQTPKVKLIKLNKNHSRNIFNNNNNLLFIFISFDH